ncbi:MAG: ABC transporter related protein [Candidatus Giovannonibacteria bacterium GW2011_GWA2_53_7]|uniref:ABC transporter related protein n=1 Tax=Candidatus Giovannonibacteria bacterium GW2011_GWA2_53_7 TaxID=1618650 RepID=A0A0G1Y0Q6_9BACT|nr:MAG: ABC transporter related protein [Candidatus Giovannonibacteria bacterium GW2011_GWA2_53_7]
MAKPIIFGDNIEITYNQGKENEFKANKGTTVQIYDQEYIILFGPSGCGKSTLLYCMFGVLQPSAGSMYVNGESIYDYDAMQMVHFQRKTMGIMYQSFNLINSITVLDNVALPLIFDGLPARERTVRAMELCRRFMIDHVANKRPTLLSGGQQQRVSVARSLVNDPQILIADEPVGNLDSITAAQVMDTLAEINDKDKKTVILVTHDAKYLPYAHRIVYMNDGRIERIVPNPEKKQILKLAPGSTIVTEIEQIARIYPYDSPKELQVKSIINYLTQSLTFDQIMRLQRFTESVIDGRMDEGGYLRMLMTDYEQGGVGVPVSEAGVMADKLVHILEHSRDIARYRRVKAEDVTQVRNTEFVNRIAEFIATQVGLELSPQQKDRFEESIAQRIGGFTKRDEFMEQILTPVEERGVGLSKKLAQDTTRLSEKLIAQGILHVGEAHH